MFQYWKLKQFIEERGLIQKFVAQKTGIEEVALSNILNGRQRCSLENYVKLCNFFNVPFNSFIDPVVGDSDTKKTTRLCGLRETWIGRATTERGGESHEAVPF